MKAVYITKQGPPEVLTYGELPDPVPGPGEVVARVRACALNHRDVYLRAGVRGLGRELKEPLILGSDVAGDVLTVGPGVTNVKPGNRVLFHVRWGCGDCEYCQGGRDNLCPNRLEPGIYSRSGAFAQGGYAELFKAPARHAHLFPDWMSYEEAASIPLTAITAWHMLVKKVGLRPGEKVLVLGASGGVGSMGVQIAKVMHGWVIATASSEEKALAVKKFGADEVVNYGKGELAQRVKELTGGQGVDVVFDSVGTDVWEQAFASLGPGGRFVTCGVTSGYKVELHLGQLFSQELTVMGVSEGPAWEFLDVMRLVNMGKLRGFVGATFPLNQAQQAHRLMEARSFTGKVVLRVD